MIHIRFGRQVYKYLYTCKTCGVEFLDNYKWENCPKCTFEITSRQGVFIQPEIFQADCIKCGRKYSATNPAQGYCCNIPLEFFLNVCMGAEQLKRFGFSCPKCKKLTQHTRSIQNCCGILYRIVFVREYSAHCDTCDLMTWDIKETMSCRKCKKEIKGTVCSNT